jgi:Phosphatidylserine/phosphatidylglycerophosphate/cardiolipin synthases and related enzymes
MSRITLIDHATRSVDLQYYIFANDATGRLVAQRLLAAADRACACAC